LILADSSIWIDHFRSPDPHLAGLVVRRVLCCHPAVIGELACGNLSDRDLKLGFLQALHRSPVLSDGALLRFISTHKLMGRGIGYIDVQLLASSALDAGKLWTRDKRLKEAAESLGLSY
jgi:predicted nucleic acid-binding protein